MTDREKLEELRDVLAKTTARHQGLGRLEAAVRRMRDQQKAYFSRRQTRDLEAARRAEREVDSILAELATGQGTLIA